jgi:hypothetical protein
MVSSNRKMGSVAATASSRGRAGSTSGTASSLGDTRNKRLFGSDKPASVNLDGASFICVKEGNSNTPAQKNDGGFWQKLGNFVRGSGWKTDAEVTAGQRQWLIDKKVQRGKVGEGLSPVHWSKATDEDVHKAYDYIQQVRIATSVNRQAVVPPAVLSAMARDI